MDLWMYGCMDVWMDVWMYVWMYVCSYTVIDVSICPFVDVVMLRVYVYILTGMYIYIYIYIHIFLYMYVYERRTLRHEAPDLCSAAARRSSDRLQAVPFCTRVASLGSDFFDA